MNYFDEKSLQVKPGKFTAFGILINSRYSKSYEIIEMLEFCKIIAAKEITCIKEVFYDSKASLCNFTFEFNTFTKEEEDIILKAAEKTISQFMWIDGQIYQKESI